MSMITLANRKKTNTCKKKPKVVGQPFPSAVGMSTLEKIMFVSVNIKGLAISANRIAR